MQTHLRLIRLRFRRRLRKGQRQVEDLGQQAEQGLEQHFFRRFGHLAAVRRFVSGWLTLVILLIVGILIQNLLLSGYFQALRPVPGGIYDEGVLGRFTNASPLYATSDVDTTVSHLIFAGLFSYDDQNRLVGDLASGYSVDAKGTTYTVHLKPHLTWQDGQPLTSADVVFTYQMIQNPDAESPLQTSWQGITVSSDGLLGVTFKLPNPLASFPDSLTNGIIPRHLLASIPPVDMRSADFNTEDPVGAGPFAWQAVQVTGSDPNTAEEQIALIPFAHYQGGRPKLQQFVVHAYADQTQLTQAFKSNQLDGAEGLNSVPSALHGMTSLQSHTLLLSAATMVFFRTSDGVLADTQVRQALVQAADVPQIMTQLGYATVAVREPLLANQLGYNPIYRQAGFNLTAAKALLTADGWVVGNGGLRDKAGQPLEFSLTAADTPEYHLVVRDLQRQWQQLGVRLEPQFLDSADFQSALSQHDYSAVLYGISIGIDPDVFVYWDSSQADPRSPNRLNLSEYKNATADASLEGGRTRLDPTLRIIKYQPFLQAWQQDNPALGLYQPRLLYLTDGQVAGLTDHTINTATDRFDNVQNWEIREAKVTD
jgi:peptide/nickel transport system substrate-binding protein